MRTDFYFPSYGKGMIHGCRWEPEGTPKGIVQIVHGVAEYAARYDDFATFLTRQGYLVVAEDHMGHGGSVGEGAIGYFEGGWFKAVADCHRLLSYTRMEYPDLPYILFGHSMGSFMVRTMLIKYPKCNISAAILCGTGWVHRGILNSGLAMTRLLCKTEGADKPSKTASNLLFRGYNRRVEHKKTDYDWLTRDSMAVMDYIEDPMCGFHITPGLARDMLTGMRFNQEPENLEKMKKSLPVLFIAGGDDPVGNYGEGVTRTRTEFAKAGMKYTDLRIYPLCRHELLNEINHKDVYEFILNWLNKRHIVE